MALNLTELTTGGTAAPSASVDTASVSPGANRPLYLFVHAGAIGATAPAIPTITGNGLTWVQEKTVTQTDGVSFTHRMSLFRAMGASPTSGVITIAHGAVVPDNTLSWTLVEATDADTSGTNGSGSVVQSVTNTGSSTTASATLAAFGSAANNGAYIAVGTVEGGTSLTPEAGYTGFTSDTRSSSITRAAWKVGEDTSPTMTLGATKQWAAIALEIKQLVPPPDGAYQHEATTDRYLLEDSSGVLLTEEFVASAARRGGPLVVGTAVHRASRW